MSYVLSIADVLLQRSKLLHNSNHYLCVQGNEEVYTTEINFPFRNSKPRDAYAEGGGQERQLPPLPLSMETGDARIALHIEFFQSLLSSEGAFSRFIDTSVQEIFSGGKPQTPKLPLHH